MKIEIQVRRDCELCKGSGAILNPDWVLFRDVGGLDRPEGPEAIQCPDCCGCGFIQEWIPLEELESEAIINLSARVGDIENKLPVFTKSHKERGR